MPSVIRHPPRWAVQMMYIVPSDYVLKDRFGVVQNETAFLQRVEDNLLIARQWMYDVTGGYTFNLAPTLWFRTSRTAAQLYSTYARYDEAIFDAMLEMQAIGVFDTRSRHRLPGASLTISFEGANNSLGADNYGCPFLAWGAFIGGGPGIKILGGMFPDFVSVPTTITAGASSSATTLQVASGTGKSFAVAAMFHFYAARVQSAPSSPTGGTQIQCTNVDFAATSLPMDAVVWPYGQKPSVSNAEAVQVTAVNTVTNTVTVVRGRYGTTPIAIQGGGSGGGGWNIGRRLKQARIWTSPAPPEGTGFDVVSVDGISGDTLTVSRGARDAYSYGSFPVPRAILSGDNIVVTEQDELWFYQTQNQVIGATLHEMGHNWGLRYYNPSESLTFDYVDHAPGGGVVIRQRDINDYAGNQRSVESVYRAGNWVHLPHTPDNPLTPDVFTPYVMFDYWNFPFGNVPAPDAGWTANELARILTSPYLTVQARPVKANVVTQYSFRDATGGFGPH